MQERFPAEEPKRVPGRYVVYFVILFAFGVAMFATWGIRVMRKLPPEAFRHEGEERPKQNQKPDSGPRR